MINSVSENLYKTPGPRNGAAGAKTNENWFLNDNKKLR
jgi:hypothetical protein